MAEQLNKSRYCNGLLKNVASAHLPPETQLSDELRPFQFTMHALKHEKGKAVSLLKKLPKPMLPGETRRDIQARRSSHVMKIISEFVEAGEECAVQPAVGIYGSARTPKKTSTTRSLRLARKLSDAGFSVISGGGPAL